MLKGIGTDIVEIERIEKAIVSTKGFLEKIYTEKELDEWELAGKRMERMAGNFAAKEAVSKALGTGFRTFAPKDIEICRDDKGKPYVTLYEGAKVCADALNTKQILLSISHCKTYAVAMVTIEGWDLSENSK
ncbi:MAG: holo-ACP synthase [Cellulosilyticaceae bacterium]